MKTLDELALLHGTDKSSSGHNYAVKYDRILSPSRQHVQKVLEIGVAGGNSLRMWRDYFPNAQVYGLDNNSNCLKHTDERITVIVGDQGNEGDLAKAAEHGPFDLILDDGSHLYTHQIKAFERLWDSVTVGGLYVVEDIYTSYWPNWDKGINTLDYFRYVINYVNFVGIATPTQHRRETLIATALATRASYYPTNVHSAAFYNGFITLEKGSAVYAPEIVRKS